VQCSERERLESALAEMVSRLDYLTKLSHGDPSLDRLTQEIERLSLRVEQAKIACASVRTRVR
jgi:hypothetical protein